MRGIDAQLEEDLLRVNAIPGLAGLFNEALEKARCGVIPPGELPGYLRGLAITDANPDHRTALLHIAAYLAGQR